MKVSCLAPGLRLDAALAEQSGLSRSAVQRLIAQGNVTKNGAPVSKNEKTDAAAVYEISVPPPQPSEAKPQQIALDIVYEDADIIVVNKPKGMVVHPAAGHADGTLVNALLFQCPQSLSGIGGVMRPGIVHRIDKDTAGLLMVAKMMRRTSPCRSRSGSIPFCVNTAPLCLEISGKTAALWMQRSRATRPTASAWQSAQRPRRGRHIPHIACCGAFGSIPILPAR